MHQVTWSKQAKKPTIGFYPGSPMEKIMKEQPSQKLRKKKMSNFNKIFYKVI